MIRLLLSSFFLLATVGLRAADPAKPGKEPACDCELISAYLPVAKALAADDLGGTQRAAVAFVKQARADGMTPLAETAQSIATAKDLTAARTLFKRLSADVEPLAADDDGLVVMNCPMAHADWVQPKGATQNPYFGKAMLTCGEPKKAK